MRSEEIDEQLSLVFIELCEKFVDFLENSPAVLNVEYEVNFVRAAKLEISFLEEGLIVRGMLFPANEYAPRFDYKGKFERAKFAARDRLKAQQRLSDLEILEKAQRDFAVFRNGLED